MLAGIVGWFELEMTPGTWLSTAPGEPPTHWQHLFFPIRTGYQVRSGMNLRVSIKYEPPKDDHRGMKVDLWVQLPGTNQITRQKYEMK